MAGFCIGLVDGTGPYSGHQYENDFMYSFLKQTKDKLGSMAHYEPGPGSAGQTTFDHAETVLKKVKSHWYNNKDDKIFLGGYSRGGAAAIYIAQQLAISYGGPIPVEALFLLDPVSKDTVCQGGIPGNVSKCYTMYRDLTILEYDGELNTANYESWLDKITVIGFVGIDPDRYRRKWMGSCSVAPLPGNRKTQYFGGEPVQGASHGAVGGLTWTDRKADEAASIRAAHRLDQWYIDNNIPAHVCEMYCSDATRKNAMSDDDIKAKVKRDDEVRRRLTAAVTNAEVQRDQAARRAGISGYGSGAKER